MSSEILDLIKKRRSIRNYTKEKVPNKVMMELIEAAIYAPSGSNIQPWYFVIIENDEINNKIKAFAPGLLGHPPNLIIICRDLKRAYERGGEFCRDELSIIDISMAAQNILLLATEKGMSTCVVKSYNKQAIERLLNLPKDISADIIISIGYSDFIPRIPKRKSVNEVTYINEWGISLNE